MLKKNIRPYYRHRGIEIYHGDALELLPRFRRRFDLVLCDPPYKFQSVSGGGFTTKIYDDPKFRAMCSFEPEPFLDAVAAVQQPLNLVATCSRDLVPRYAREALQRGWVFDLHVWHKPNAVPFCSGCFKSDIEYVVLLYQSGRPWRKGHPQRNYTKVFTRGTVRKNKVHPTQKPLELMQKYLNILCPDNGVVLDPYMGSGTTLVAAKQLGFRAVGIDWDIDNCKIARDRIQEAAQHG